MPVYQYHCKDCEAQFDAQQRITDKPLTKCSECGGRIHRVIQPVGVIFKGSGFHINDYPNSKGRKRSDLPPATREGETKPTGSSDSTSSDSAEKETKPAEKPAASSETKPSSKNGTSPKKSS